MKASYVIVMAIATLFCHFTALAYTTYPAAIDYVAIHHDNPSPLPLTILEGSHVRMITFTNIFSYKTTDKKLPDDIWVTVASELKNGCASYVKRHPRLTHKQLTFWMARLLGMSLYQAENYQLVIFDVPIIQAYYGVPYNTIGIFRPCMDPRIDRHEDSSPACPTKMDVNDRNIASEYKTWFINNSIASYTLKKEKTSQQKHYVGYPWTGYGYTYNWNPEAANVYGLSEFVVLKNTPITMLPNPNSPKTVYITPEQYCKSQ